MRNKYLGWHAKRSTQRKTSSSDNYNVVIAEIDSGLHAVGAWIFKKTFVCLVVKEISKQLKTHELFCMGRPKLNGAGLKTGQRTPFRCWDYPGSKDKLSSDVKSD